MSEEVSTEKKNKKLALKLVLVVIGMLVFVFAVLVPFYDVFCRMIGIGNRADTNAAYVQEPSISATKQTVDESRWVKVQFLANNNADIGWEFRPMIGEMKVHPGAVNEMHYYVKNTTPVDMVGQAVHSVTPPQAGEYFHKTECFCFRRQPLAHGESRELPLKFVIDRNLPKEVQTMTVSYTMFDADAGKQK